jgi:nicotinamide mononucleotide transporter
VISILELIATFFGISYVVLIILKKPIGWVFGVISSLIFVQISWDANLYIQTILQLIYVIIGIVGYFRWNNSNQKIRILTRNQKIILYILALLISYGIGFGTSFTNQSLPYLDAFITVFGIVATYLTSEKHIENWIIWIIVNSLSILLFAQQGLYMSAFLFGVYLVLSIIGLIHWNNDKLRGKTN